MTENWRTREGRTIPIREMANRHLINATNMCLRACRVAMHDEADAALHAMSFLRGEMALAEAEHAIDELQTYRDIADVVRLNAAQLPSLPALVDEVKRRKLDKLDTRDPFQYEVPS